MSRFISLRVTPLLAALVVAGCGLDFSTPRAYRCSSDEECRGGWRCLGDAYCHDPEVGVATACGVDGDCAGGWRCLGDRVCHDPEVGVATGCTIDRDCAGGWKCLGDKVCHDATIGVATACVADSECAAGWQCLGDKVCHDPTVGATTPCVASSECAAGWQCLGDNVCHDPAIGVATRCVADSDCAGGWLCLGDNVCHDPAIGVTTACVVDGDCAASWRCLGDKLCHDPALGVSTPCLASADCSGGWVCADRLCRDPAIGVTVPCSTSADCLGGWYCALEQVCRNPANPGPFPCAVDAQCAGGWRCSTEGLCADAAAEFAAVPPVSAPPAVDVLSPRVPVPSLLRAVAPAFLVDGGVLSTQLSAVGVVPGGLLVTSLASTPRAGTLGYEHQPSWSFVAVDAGVLADVVVVGGVTVVLDDKDQVFISVDGGPLMEPDTKGARPRRLGSVTRGVGPALAMPMPVIYTEEGAAYLVLPDGSTRAWGTRVIDLVAGEAPDGGFEHVAAWLDVSASEYVVDRVDLSATGPGSGGSPWTTGANGSDPQLLALRTRGGEVAGAFRAPQFGTLPVGGPTRLWSDYATLLSLFSSFAPDDLTANCPWGETLEDFEVVDSDGELGVEVACRGASGDGLLVFVTTRSLANRLVFERRHLLHHGAAASHASATRAGVVGFTTRLADDDLSTLLARRPSVLGRLGGVTVAVGGAQVFSLQGLGLTLEGTEADLPSLPVGLVQGASSVVVGYGAGIGLGGDAGSQLVFALEGTPRIQRAAGVEFGRATIVSGDDTLYAAARRDAGVTVLRSVLRPTPGFPLDDWAVRPLDGGFEGWVVANNQLFSVQANTIDRWRSTTWPLRNRDVLGVWWAGPGARVATTSGEVFSLPSRVPVAPAVAGGITSVGGRCGDAVAVSADGLLRLGADGGWVALDAGVARPLVEPSLLESERGLYVVDEGGTVLELVFTVGADGGCP